VRTASIPTWRGCAIWASATKRLPTWPTSAGRCTAPASETLLAANDLPPLEDDDLRMGDLRYVSGALDKTTK
jgi:hypothetical protein